MSAYKNDTFDERRNSAATARKAMLEKFRAQPKPDDPAVIERQAAQRAIEEARDARTAERKVAREAEVARLAAEEQARIAEQQAREIEDAAREKALKAEQKAARDARYAARKARR